MLFTVWNTQIGSWSYIEKRRGRREIEVTRRRRGRREIEVTRRRRGGVKRGETNLASSQFPRCFPQPETPREIHRIK